MLFFIKPLILVAANDFASLGKVEWLISHELSEPEKNCILSLSAFHSKSTVFTFKGMMGEKDEEKNGTIKN